MATSGSGRAADREQWNSDLAHQKEASNCHKEERSIFLIFFSNDSSAWHMTFPARWTGVPSTLIFIATSDTLISNTTCTKICSPIALPEEEKRTHYDSDAKNSVCYIHRAGREAMELRERYQRYTFVGPD